MKSNKNLKPRETSKSFALKITALVGLAFFISSCAVSQKEQTYRLTTKALEKDQSATFNAKSPLEIDSIMMLAADDAPDQEWQIVPAGQNLFRIVNKSVEGKSLEVKDTKTDTAIRLAETANDDGQLWDFVKVENDYYRLTNKWRGANKSLAAEKVEDYQIYLLERNDKDSQLWKKIDVGGGYFRLVNKLHGDEKTLFPFEDGPLGMEPAKDNSFTYQHWKTEPAGSDFHRIVNRFEAEKNLARSIEAGVDLQARYPVTMNAASSADAQRWKLEPAGGDYFRLTNANGKSLQMDFISKTAIFMKDTDDKNPNQLWKMIKN